MTPGRRVRRCPRAAARSRSTAGEAEAHDRAPAGGGIRRYRAAVAKRDLADDGEAEARPRGGPGRRGPVEAVEDERQVVGVDAGAVVAHGELAVGQPDLDRPLGRAELGRVVEQVLDRHPEPVGAAVDRARAQVGVELGLRPVPPGRVEGVGRHRVEPDLRIAPARRGSPRARSVTLTTRRLSSSTWSATRARTSVRSAAGMSGCSSEHVGVDAEAGERGAQLVAGVADQPPLRVKRPLQRAQHGVERHREPAELVPAPHFDPPARVTGQRDLLGHAGQPGDRREPGPGHRPAEQGGREHADHAEHGEHGADARDLLIGRGHRLGHLDGEAGGDLLGVHHRPDVVDPGEGVERSPAVPAATCDGGRARRRAAAVARRRPDLRRPT